ncbi:MAG: carbohydrate ABC transporter permease, partial [Bacteroidota bacterium]|nr:carbohydrate ABC transporter permease [Bacteroidota bacterium]
MKKELTVFEKYTKQLKKSKFSTIIIYIFLSLWGITTIFPFIWVLNNSFKTTKQFIKHPFALATSLNLENYKNAFSLVKIGKSYMNSFIISGTTTILVLLIAGIAAYILARFKFKFRKTIQNALAAAMLIPAFATVIPQYMMINKLGLMNTRLGLIIIHTAMGLTFAILVLSAYMASLPEELEEAAILDGCNRWQIFTKVIIPLSSPAFATVGIFSF